MRLRKCRSCKMGKTCAANVTVNLPEIFVICADNFHPYTITASHGETSRKAIFSRILYLLISNEGEDFGPEHLKVAEKTCKEFGVTW